MSEKGSVFQKGGGGTNFEQLVQTAFLTTLIVKGNAPCLNNAQITEIAFQTTSLGYATDDLLAITKSHLGRQRLIAQIKHNLTISDSKSNIIFKDVIAAFWKDFNNQNTFDQTRDKLVIIKSNINQNEHNHVKSILNWAKTHSSAKHFYKQVNRIKAKKAYLEIFAKVVAEINEGKKHTKKDLWKFLKCIELIEYDFLNTGSVDQSNFLNLIKLTRNQDSTITENEIWDSILSLVSSHNKDGGSFTFESISQNEIFRHFNVKKISPYSISLEKLRKDGELILGPIKNTIGEIHLDRTNQRSEIYDSINKNKITIVTGNPGVGKSAIIKELLESEYSNSPVFVFRADQFNFPHLSNVFTNLGIDEPIQDIISCVSLIPDKLIVIDSLEKLLEGEEENAFKQLLYLIDQFPDIKIVTSCRKYAIDLLTLKYQIKESSLKIIDIQGLNDSELEIISDNYPNLKPLFKNKKLKSLLESPKYLDFTLIALNRISSDLTKISITKFKNILWENIVANTTVNRNGIDRLRDKSFSNIAIKRAKKMTLFVEPDEDCAQGISALLSDEVIVKEIGSYKFSPAHDILEDWALIRFVNSIFEEIGPTDSFYDQIGSEPAMRRAFRLWIEENLMDGDTRITELVSWTLENAKIHKYWSDEILTAIFRSSDCSLVFRKFESELLNSQGFLLRKFIFIVRTTCQDYNESFILQPIGSGWKELLNFIESNINLLDDYRSLIIRFLLDWKSLLDSPHNSNLDGINSVKIIVVHYLNQIENRNNYWAKNKLKNDVIDLLFSTVQISKIEIKDLIERSLKLKSVYNNSGLQSFYKSVIERSLSCLKSIALIKELPELVTKTAWEEWKIKPIPENLDPKDTFGFHYGKSIRDEKCWGIEIEDFFSPSGIYKTFVYNLLNNHPNLGLKFVVDFINYAVDYYSKSDYKYKSELANIELINDENVKLKQYGSEQLWLAYRGLSVSHPAIECVLMSLEKFLLNLAEINDEISIKWIQSIFKFLISKSNNVAVSGVLTSVMMAYPKIINKDMIPLFSVKEFYHWDISRSSREFTSLSPYDMKIDFAGMERSKLNKLEHRRKYGNGLKNFTLNYQVAFQSINKEIHELFDKLKNSANFKDVDSKKLLAEIDLRNYKVSGYDEDKNGLIIEPNYDSELNNLVKANENFRNNQEITSNFTDRVLRAYTSESDFSLEEWRECHSYYSDESNTNKLIDRPITLGIIGLRDFHQILSIDEVNWCKTILEETLYSICGITKELTIKSDFHNDYNLLEKDTAICSIHLLIESSKSLSEKETLIKLILLLLTSDPTNPEVKTLTDYFRTIFFNKFPELLIIVWNGLFKISQYRASNNDAKDQNRYLRGYNQQRESEINYTFTELSINEKISKIIDINIEDFDHLLLITSLFITPYSKDDQDNFRIIDNIVKFIIDEIHLDNSDKKGYEINGSNFRFLHELQTYFLELFLFGNLELSKRILDIMFNPIRDEKYQDGMNDFQNLVGFVKNTLKYMILRLDEYTIENQDMQSNQVVIDRFWELWNYIIDIVKTSNLIYFSNILLLSIDWKKDAVSWIPLRTKKETYKKMVYEIGKFHAYSIINVLSTIGEEELLPEGINWIKEIASDYKSNESIVSAHSERLIKRLFYNHITSIKTDGQLMSSYLWLLNILVENGSSEAYLIRENVIVYKE